MGELKVQLLCTFFSFFVSFDLILIMIDSCLCEALLVMVFDFFKLTFAFTDQLITNMLMGTFYFYGLLTRDTYYVMISPYLTYCLKLKHKNYLF